MMRNGGGCGDIIDDIIEAIFGPQDRGYKGKG